MLMTLLRGVIAGAVVIGVTELSKRSPRMGALLLTLPLVSILALVMSWTKHRDLQAVAQLTREALVLVPLGLPFFLPPAFSARLGLSFWPAFALGVALATMTISLWFRLGPEQL